MKYMAEVQGLSGFSEIFWVDSKVSIWEGFKCD